MKTYRGNFQKRHILADAAILCRESQKRLQGYREEIRQIALLLRSEKVALTQKHIARYLEHPAILRDPKVRALLRDVCREIEERT